MQLQTALKGLVDLSYQASLDQGQPAQVHLRAARKAVAQLLPPEGYRVRASGAAQNLPAVPWIAILNPDVTNTAQAGLYVCYLYRQDLTAVVLTMNQGATAHRKYWQEHARPHRLTIDNETIADLVDESMAVRRALPAGLIAGTRFDLDLGSPAFLPRAYEAGDIASITYDTANLPNEQVLLSDLHRFLAIYDAAVAARAGLTAADPGRFVTPAYVAPSPEADPGAGVFLPKDASDYRAQISAQTQVRSRRHEAVVASFGTHARAKGWAPRTDVHPRDLTLTRAQNEHVLCEVKVVKGNAQGAVREALGQLFTYRYFLYEATSQPLLMAVFSDPIGDAFVQLLDDLNIACVWSEGENQWRGSLKSAQLGLVP